MKLLDYFRKNQQETEIKTASQNVSVPLSIDFDARLLRLELQFEELRKLLLQPSVNNPTVPVLSHRGKRIKKTLVRR